MILRIIFSFHGAFCVFIIYPYLGFFFSAVALLSIALFGNTDCELNEVV